MSKLVNHAGPLNAELLAQMRRDHAFQLDRIRHELIELGQRRARTVADLDNATELPARTGTHAALRQIDEAIAAANRRAGEHQQAIADIDARPATANYGDAA